MTTGARVDCRPNEQTWKMVLHAEGLGCLANCHMETATASFGARSWPFGLVASFDESSLSQWRGPAKSLRAHDENACTRLRDINDPTFWSVERCSLLSASWSSLEDAQAIALKFGAHLVVAFRHNAIRIEKTRPAFVTLHVQ